ncbi:hypothetical protein [Pseudonocardia sp. NPDC049154]|uniref:hypothetical protein n=1 Tax=Pseudonocardia sp. NPDC049154 TaxID=3155501 RepID=UPI0033CDF01D
MFATTVLQVGVPFLWCGAVLAISFLETPLKFRAAGITLQLGLGIGALVFRALNLGELVLAVVLTAVLAIAPSGLALGLLGGLWALLLVQVLVVRRRLDHRTAELIAGAELPRSRLHLVYIVLELAKIALLPTLAVQALATAMTAN